MLSGKVEEAWESGTRSDENGVEAFFVHEFIDGYSLTDDHIGLEDHAAATEDIDFMTNNLFWKTEFGNAVNQHPPELVECLEDVDLMAHLDEIASTGQTGRATSDESNFPSACRR